MVTQKDLTLHGECSRKHKYIHVRRHGVTTNSHFRSKLSRHSKVKRMTWNVRVMKECSLKIGPFIVQHLSIRLNLRIHLLQFQTKAANSVIF